MTGSIRIFEKLNFIPKLRYFVFLKVKLPDMTDWLNQRTRTSNERIERNKTQKWSLLS